MIKSDYYSNLFDEIKFLDTSKFNGVIQDEEIFYVDLNTRNIEVPDAFKKELAIRGDHKAETVWFVVNKHFDGKDLEGYTWGVQVEDAKKNRKLLLLNPKADEAGKSQEEEFDKDALFLGWPITFDVTEYAGDISIALCCYTIEEDGESKTLKYRLGTNAVKLHIKDSLYINDETENIVPNPSQIEELIAKADALLGASGDLEIDWSNVSRRPEIRIDNIQVLPGNGGDIINFSSAELTNVNYNKLTNKPIYTINNKVLESNTPFSFSFDDLLTKPVYKLKDKSSNEYELVNGEAFDISVLKLDYSQIEGTPEMSYDQLDKDSLPKITVDGKELTVGIDKIEVSKIMVDNNLNGISENPVQNKVLYAEIQAIKDELGNMSFIPIEIKSFEADNYLFEIGSIATPTLSWELSKAPVSLNLTANGDEVSNANEDYTSSELRENTKFELNVSDGKTSAKDSLDIKFVNRIYWGVAAEPEQYDSNFIQSLDSELLETKEKTFTVNAVDNEYIYFAIPVSYGEAIAYVGGFEGGFEVPQQITVTNEYNSTDYYLYKSTNPKLGNTTVVVY